MIKSNNINILHGLSFIYMYMCDAWPSFIKMTAIIWVLEELMNLTDSQSTINTSKSNQVSNISYVFSSKIQICQEYYTSKWLNA